MEIIYLGNDRPFPDPLHADQSGLLAAGGDLTIDRLLEAYSRGIFPWYSEGEPVLWWSPDPRMILFPEDLHVSKKMKLMLRKNFFTVTVNRAFSQMIDMCSRPRSDGMGTWITEEMKYAYTELHRAGFAHSIEVWLGETLAGGLYGVSFGKMFFGESMFSVVSNSSKFGFIKLTEYLMSQDFRFIDCQVNTTHLRSLGAISIDRKNFLKILGETFHQNKLGKTVFPDSL